MPSKGHVPPPPKRDSEQTSLIQETVSIVRSVGLTVISVNNDSDNEESITLTLGEVEWIWEKLRDLAYDGIATDNTVYSKIFRRRPVSSQTPTPTKKPAGS